jgi:hypothetical protein
VANSRGESPRPLGLYQIQAVAKCPELTRAGKDAMLLAKLRYHARLLRRDQLVDCVNERERNIAGGSSGSPPRWARRR